MSQKTFLCQRVERINFNKVKSIAGDEATFYSSGNKFEAIPDAANMFFYETGDDTAAGILVTQKLPVSFLSDASLFNELTSVPQIFKLYLSDGTVKLWGSLSRPVLAGEFKRDTNAGSISFIRKVPAFEL